MSKCEICGMPDDFCNSAVQVHGLRDRIAKLEAVFAVEMQAIVKVEPPAEHKFSCATRKGGGACDCPVDVEQPGDEDDDPPAEQPEHDEACATRVGTSRNCDCGAEEDPSRWTEPPAPAQGAPAEPLSKDINGWATHVRVQELEARLAFESSERKELSLAVSRLQEQANGWRIAAERAERERDEARTSAEVATAEAGDWAERASLARSEERERCLYHFGRYMSGNDDRYAVRDAIREGTPAK